MAPVALSGLHPSVGLEIHVRLLTPTKLFCRCANRVGAESNTLVCPVCMGLPGSLPVLSAAAVACAARVALAAGARVNRISAFDRKHYFYPDLPRNYQITQYAHPLATGGELEWGGVGFTLERMHLEEDAARLLAGPRAGTVAVDLNRAGTPLLEIVTEPACAPGAGVRTWLQGLRRLLRWLEVSDGNLEDGSLRCDANVGFMADRNRTHPWRGPWTELKNLNSPGMIGRAVDHEVERLTALAQEGSTPVHETRSWDEKAGRTRLLRYKEKTRDYRYLPEPDLPPVVLAPSQLEELAAALPELPAAREERFQGQYGISAEAAHTLCRDRVLADYFEDVAGRLAGLPNTEGATLAANWILTEVAGRWNLRPVRPEPFAVPPQKLADLLQLLAAGKLARPAAKQVFAAMLADPGTPPTVLAQRLGLDGVAGKAELETWCHQALAAAPGAAASWRQGKAAALDHLVGRVMALSGGRADPARAREVLQGLLQAEDSN